jgi:hypothetical protein
MRRDIGQRSKHFVLELKNFCQAEEGRATRLAEYLGCKPAAVYNWWGKQGRFPTTEQLLGCIEWLQRAREATRG